MLLNSRVEHDNSAGSTAVEPSVARSGSGRSPTELDSQSVAASQTSVLERYNRSASPRNASASSVRSGGPGRSTSGRSVESEARRVSGPQQHRPRFVSTIYCSPLHNVCMDASAAGYAHCTA